MFFDGGTYSKGDPQHCTLDFYTKVQVWERMVNHSLHVPSRPKDTQDKKNDVSSTLLKKEKELKKRKK
jgi:hypothetical protein